MVNTTVQYPEAPATEALKGTLLDTATVIDGIEWQDGRDLFDSFNCMKFDGSADFCGPNNKTLDQIADWISGYRFAAYGGVTCKAVGLDQQGMERRVREVFEKGESTAVERSLMATRFTADTDPTPRWDAPVDITPASGAVKPGTGIALLEGFAASEYVGGAVLHVPLSTASSILGVNGAEFEGSVLRTKFGSKIAAGAGYDYPNLGPTGAAAAAGERWLYATGSVVLMRGEPIIRQVMNTDNNDVVVLAERPYVAAVDCFAAAIRVTVE
jgi:hypothetical protein